MLRNRRGVTLIEIMTVVSMAVVMTAIAFPKLKETRRSASMQSARTQVESYLAVARSVAIRTGVRSFLISKSNGLSVMADSTGGLVTVVRPIKLKEVSGVTVETTKDTIIYDSRGLAVNLSATGEKFYLTMSLGDGTFARDSICVSRLGMVLDKKCGLTATPEKTEDAVIPDDEPILSTEPVTVGPITVGGITVK